MDVRLFTATFRYMSSCATSTAGQLIKHACSEQSERFRQEGAICLQMLQTAKAADEIVRQVQNPQLAAGLSDELNGFDVLLVQPELLQFCQCAIMVLRPLHHISRH